MEFPPLHGRSSQPPSIWSIHPWFFAEITVRVCAGRAQIPSILDYTTDGKWIVSATIRHDTTRTACGVNNNDPNVSTEAQLFLLIWLRHRRNTSLFRSVIRQYMSAKARLTLVYYTQSPHPLSVTPSENRQRQPLPQPLNAIGQHGMASDTRISATEGRTTPHIQHRTIGTRLDHLSSPTH